MADYRILWYSSTHWAVVPNTTEFNFVSAPGVGKRIDGMADADLWEQINYCVRYMRALYADERPDGPHTDVAAKLWLRNQPAFEAMVVEAVRRGLSFEPATFNYLQRFIIEPHRQRGNVIGAPPPWRDPLQLREQARFREYFKAQKKIVEEEQNPSASRAIDI